MVLQLLDKNVGNKDFFRSLVDAHRVSLSQDLEQVEKSLWKCIDVGLDQYHETEYLMVIVDALDELEGGQQQTTRVVNRLYHLASKHGNIQIVTCSRGSISNSSQGKTRNFVISSDHTHEDLRLVIDHALQGYKHFDHQGEHAREKIVDQLGDAAKGNFLWAILTVSVLRREATNDGFNKMLKAASDASMGVNELVARLTAMTDLTRTDIQMLLSWMMVVDRPLTLAETNILFQVDLAKRTFVEHNANTVDDALAVLNPFISLEGGFVRFRHSIIRQYMLNMQKDGKKLRSRRDAQADLTMRLLAYCHFTLAKPHDPTSEMMKASEVDDLFTKYGLLEYAAVHWLQHLRFSSFQQDDGTLQLTPDFKAIFPGTSRLPLLEWTCWEQTSSSSDVVHLYERALRVRQEVLTQNHRAVLQGMVVCGNAHKARNQVSEAIAYFYRASKIGQHVLRKHHYLTVVCVTTFLTLTEGLSITTRTDVATWKEELLIYIIDTYKHQHGKTHDLVIQYYKMLAQLYVDIHEEHNAEKTWREVRELVIRRFGKGSKVWKACAGDTSIRYWIR